MGTSGKRRRLRDISIPNRKTKAHARIRTGDLFLTKEVLCRLSYMGENIQVNPMEREKGLEPSTPSLEGWNSTN